MSTHRRAVRSTCSKTGGRCAATCHAFVRRRVVWVTYRSCSSRLLLRGLCIAATRPSAMWVQYDLGPRLPITLGAQSGPRYSATCNDADNPTISHPARGGLNRPRLPHVIRTSNVREPASERRSDPGASAARVGSRTRIQLRAYLRADTSGRQQDSEGEDRLYDGLVLLRSLSNRTITAGLSSDPDKHNHCPSVLF